MNEKLGRVFNLAAVQHDLVAVWQAKQLKLTQSEVNVAVRGWRRVHRGVYAIGDLSERGWFMAAALAGGPNAFVSHVSALMLLGLREHEPRDVDVTVEGRAGRRKRDGIVFHRPRGRIDGGTFDGIPVTSPTQSLVETKLPPAELFHALDRAAILGYQTTPPLDAVARLQRATHGRTRSVAEAAFVLLCHTHQIEPPRVNHRLNGFETDFHWSDAKLVVEVDGFEFHKSREQFEEDRRRGMVHNANGYSVTRVSALQVQHDPALVAAAVTERLSAQRTRGSTRRRKQPK